MPKHVCILLTKLKGSIMLGPPSTIIPSQVYTLPFSAISSAEHRGRACISNFSQSRILASYLSHKTSYPDGFSSFASDIPGKCRTASKIRTTTNFHILSSSSFTSAPIIRHRLIRPTTTLTLRRLMSYIYGAPILDVSRSHTTTQHSR